MILVTELKITRIVSLQGSLRKQIDRSGVLYTLLTREKHHDEGKLLRIKMQKGISCLTVALLYFGAKKCLAVRQAILIDITAFCGTTMHW